ncbi:MAG: guanylate kinase [Bacteroidetes bacterium]|nr:guanylate kinase [Bacteroidota bacterium]
MKGKLIIFSAPSGSGKTTIVKRLLASDLKLEFSISACSRQKRESEVDGKDYYFLSPEAFKEKIERNEFLEWEEVYPGSYYGTLLSELNRIWENGNHVVFDVDVVGGANLKEKFNKDAMAIFVMPPSIQHLEERLRGRQTESEETLKKRLDKATQELTYVDKFDEIVVNDDLDLAVEESYQIVKSFIE